LREKTSEKKIDPVTDENRNAEDKIRIDERVMGHQNSTFGVHLKKDRGKG